MPVKSETIRARVTPEIKASAEAIFDVIGLTASEAILLFYKQVILNDGLPFEVRIPNKKTQKALDDIKNHKGLKNYNSTSDFRQSLGLE